MKNQLTKTVCSCILVMFLISLELIGQWKQVNGPFLGDVQKIVFKGSDIYALVFKAGIYKSADGGNSWQPLNNGINPGSALDIAANNKKVFLTTNNGVFVLSDNETLWNRSTLATLSCNRLCCSGDTIYAGDSEGGVYTSKDCGNTWGSRIMAQTGYIFSMTAGKT